MNRKIYFIPLFLCVLLMACNPTRRLKDDETLLVKNEIKFTNGTYSKEPLLAIIKQKPNRKILGLFRFHLWLYNTVDPARKEKKREEKVNKWEAWNVAHPDKKQRDTSQVTTFGDWIQNIGEGPVILDTSLTVRSAKQLELFLTFKKGYFDATVKDTIEMTGKKKAEVIYTINLGQPYKIKSISDTSLDQNVMHYVNLHKSETLLDTGNIYDADVLDKERARITADLRNNGFYFFNKNYIVYSVDSNLNSHQVTISLYINRVNENPSEQAITGGDIRDHYQYDINKVFIQDDYNPQHPDESVATDTSYYKDFIFLTTSPFERFKHHTLTDVIFFQKGDRFDLSKVNYTYTRVSALNVFRFTNIKFEEVSEDSSAGKHLLNSTVQLTQIPMQDVSLEPEATKSGGNYGIAGNIAYHNRNLFRGAELLEIKMKLALESQQNITGTIEPSQQLFNAFEFGPEMDYTVNRFLFPANVIANIFGFRREINPKTTFTVSYNFQDRPDYHRSIFAFSYWFTWKQSETSRFNLYPFEFSYINATYVSPAFQQNLNTLGNLALSNSFKTHTILSLPRLSYEFSDQEKKHGINFNYVRVNFDNGLKSKYLENSFSYDKIDADYRHYFKINTHNTFVGRFFAGIGIPRSGDVSLPFEKSFYAGGSNDIRAWRFSTLGPGSISNPLGLEQAGNFKLEGNLELRSELFKFFEGAAFLDGGNIWNTHKSAEGAQGAEALLTSNFLNQVAVGGGLGIRLNFGFFIFRVDGAVKLIDPSLAFANKFVYSHQAFALSDINFNFGIGYPF